jgi:hypothetical protein
MALRRVLTAGVFWVEWPGIPGRHRFDRATDVEDDGTKLHALFSGPAIHNAGPNDAEPPERHVRVEVGRTIAVAGEALFEREDDPAPFTVRPGLVPVTVPVGHYCPQNLGIALNHTTETRALDAQRILWWLEHDAEHPYAGTIEPISVTLRRIADGLKSGEFDLPGASP